jgi:hypothetical protein
MGRVMSGRPGTGQDFVEKLQVRDTRQESNRTAQRYCRGQLNAKSAQTFLFLAAFSIKHEVFIVLQSMVHLVTVNTVPIVGVGG